LVDDIGKQHLIAPRSDDYSKWELELNLVDIRTEEENEKLPKIKCAAALHVNSFATIYKYREFKMTNLDKDPPLNKKTLIVGYDEPITYTLEKTSEGKLFATVYGLPPF
jgi:hypothetical protein